jgi:hypothetical protein
MTITKKTTLQLNIEAIERSANTAVLAAASAAHSLNNSFNVFWNLPDDQLTELLQHLFNEGVLMSIFQKHAEAAAMLNKILEDGEHTGVRAIDKITREFTIDESGIVSLVVPPPPEPVIESELEVVDN